MTNYNERLDEILSAVYLAGTENGLSRRLTDAKEIMHRKEAFINGNPVSKEAKQALNSLTKELVAEAKPYGKRQFRELIEDAWYKAPTAAAGFGRIEAIHNQFEQNLLKSLESNQ